MFFCIYLCLCLSFSFSFKHFIAFNLGSGFHLLIIASRVARILKQKEPDFTPKIAKFSAQSQNFPLKNQAKFCQNLLKISKIYSKLPKSIYQTCKIIVRPRFSQSENLVLSNEILLQVITQISSNKRRVRISHFSWFGCGVNSRAAFIRGRRLY